MLLGRVVWFDRTLPLEQQLDNIQVRYIVNDIDCGSAKRVNTVREWLARSGSPRTMSSSSAGTGSLSAPSSVMRKLEEAHCPPALLVVFWRTVYKDFYLNYDTSKEFMPQFLSMADQVEPLKMHAVQMEPVTLRLYETAPRVMAEDLCLITDRFLFLSYRSSSVWITR